MTIEQTIIDIKNKINSIEEQRKLLLKELQEQFPLILKPLLEKFTQCNGIRWTQYTPYFNDGEICEFSRHDVYAYESLDDNIYENPECIEEWLYVSKITEEQHSKMINAIKTGQFKRTWYDKPYNPNSSGYILNENFNKNDADIIAQVDQLFSSIPDEFFKELFGDHCEVIITKEGVIIVNGYDHD